MKPLVNILEQSGVLFTSDISKLANFSLHPLKKIIEMKANHLSDLFTTLFDFFEFLDVLMCEGMISLAFCLLGKRLRVNLSLLKFRLK